jgi:hypothetical protein
MQNESKCLCQLENALTNHLMVLAEKVMKVEEEMG